MKPFIAYQGLSIGSLTWSPSQRAKLEGLRTGSNSEFSGSRLKNWDDALGKHTGSRLCTSGPLLTIYGTLGK